MQKYSYLLHWLCDLSVKPLYIIINKTNVNIGESNENKHLTLVSTDESKAH